jgi:hypothetical protein
MPVPAAHVLLVRALIENVQNASASEVSSFRLTRLGDFAKAEHVYSAVMIPPAKNRLIMIIAR